MRVSHSLFGNGVRCVWYGTEHYYRWTNESTLKIQTTQEGMVSQGEVK